MKAAASLICAVLMLASLALAGGGGKEGAKTPPLSVNAAPLGRVVQVAWVPLAPRGDGPVFYAPAHLRAALLRPGEHWQPAYATDQPQAYVSVYPLAGLKVQYPGQEEDTVDTMVSQQIHTLQTIIATRQIPAGELPYFPPLNAFQAMRGAVKFISTPQLRGVRYLTIHSQDSGIIFPRTAVEYTFQGFTRDGKNLVVMHVPYPLSSLPTPEQIQHDKNRGFVAPFPTSQDGPDAQLFQKKNAEYLKWISEQLNAASDSLSKPDSVVKSIRLR